MRNCAAAVSGIVTGVITALTLGEMPSDRTSEAKELVIPTRCDDDPCARRQQAELQFLDIFAGVAEQALHGRAHAGRFVGHVLEPDLDAAKAFGDPVVGVAGEPERTEAEQRVEDQPAQHHDGRQLAIADKADEQEQPHHGQREAEIHPGCRR